MKQELTQEEKCVKIALACGYKAYHYSGGTDWIFIPIGSFVRDEWEEGVPQGSYTISSLGKPPDYLNDHNAISDAVERHIMQGDFWKSWRGILKQYDPVYDGWFTNASQRAEALGKTLQLW